MLESENSPYDFFIFSGCVIFLLNFIVKNWGAEVYIYTILPCFKGNVLLEEEADMCAKVQVGSLLGVIFLVLKIQYLTKY